MRYVAKYTLVYPFYRRKTEAERLTDFPKATQGPVELRTEDLLTTNPILIPKQPTFDKNSLHFYSDYFVCKAHFIAFI